MLILNRRYGEKVVITLPHDGRKIVVSVEEIEYGRVRLGFVADEDIRINRQEVEDRREAKNASGNT